MKKIILLSLLLPFLLIAQKPYRVGTTVATFLEIGYGSAGVAMGDAYVAMARDLSSIYWNPAGLAFMQKNEALFTLQPWVVDINQSYTAAGLVIPGVGTVAVGITTSDYGEMQVTTERDQEGTGEYFSASDFSISLGYAREIVDGFAFGIAGKYIGSNIWHMSASALALDLGVSLRTPFFSPTDDRADGMQIGMSISNYGTNMKYDGMDLLQIIDISENESGNYGYVEGKYSLREWELPLIFRLGVAVNVLKMEDQSVFLAIDALHPNNNAESVNLGGEYQYKDPTFGKFSLRGGYKGLFLDDEVSEFGLTVGAGLEKLLMNNIAIKVDYAYRDVGILGNVHCYTIGFLF